MTTEIETETPKGKDRDYWVGQTRTINGKELWVGHCFVHYGKKYVVTKTAETICTGVVAEVSPSADRGLSGDKGLVATPPDKQIIPPPTADRIMQQPKTDILPLIPVSKRGRPLKRGEVHRVTEWRRRQKMKQVVMM